MKIENRQIYSESMGILKNIYGPGAQFRDGQYEAIEAAMTRKRTLVVQKTGWGKSLVYFMCTKLNRSRGQGMTLVISPLLVLMDNQMEMARGMGLRCAALNSTVKDKDERKQIHSDMANGEVDMVFITPETLMKEDTQKLLPQLRIGLFVVDEAHCISDWGHDFRLEYGKLGRVVSGSFSNVAVLATTATANDRVVADLKKQLGDDVYISRGPLTRESLHIQVLQMEKKHDRYAWLLDNLPKLPGTGIIYCLDKRDCDYLAAFLDNNGIPAMSYYSRNEKEENKNDEALAAFRGNRIKAIVATVKLGMGYDKGDVSFVIHFQMPSSVVSWYQQIGRAGRSLKDAYVFLMSGKEDREINEYFIRTAFPEQEESEQIIRLISDADGISKSEVFRRINARRPRIEKTLYFLEKEGFIRQEKIGTKQFFFPTVRRYVYNGQHYEAVRSIRRQEMEQMERLLDEKGCLSRFAVNCLDDKEACSCGKCANCTGMDIFPGLTLSEASRQKAAAFISQQQVPIEPRHKWPDGTNIPKDKLLQPGICLSKFGDPGYGELVRQGKYPPKGMPKRFDEELVGKSAKVLREMIDTHHITHITCVPSLRSNLVEDFARRLAVSTGLTFVNLLEKTPAPEQKTMENSTFQHGNAWESFHVRQGRDMPKRVLLVDDMVDDMVDSRWTLTVCGYKIMDSGCEQVYPFALADTSHWGE